MQIILPSDEVRLFLLEVIQKASYPGTMVEFVASVKKAVGEAEIKPDSANGNAESIKP